MSDSQRPSTGTIVLQAMKDDGELVSLIQGVRMKYPADPDRARSVVQNAIEQALSTSTLTADYGNDRPSGLEFFKDKLRWIVNGV